MTAEADTCGHPLKTRPCRREPLWPGGKCAHHGYGASTLYEWARGLSQLEGWYQPRLGFSACGLSTRGHRVSWSLLKPDGRIVVHWWVSRSRGRELASGYLDPEEAAVIADMLEAEGYGDHPRVSGWIESLRRQVTKAMRAKMRRAGEDAEAIAAAARLREVGLDAIAVDDMLVIPRGAIAGLLRALDSRA